MYVTCYLLQFNESLEAGFRNHVPDVEQRLFSDDWQGFVQLDPTQVNIQGAVQPRAEADIRVEKYLHVYKQQTE